MPRRTAGTWEKAPAEKHTPTKTLWASQLPVALCPSPKFQASFEPETQLQTVSMPACNQDFKFNNVTGFFKFPASRWLLVPITKCPNLKAQTTGMDSHSLEARSQKSRCEQGLFLPEALGQNVAQASLPASGGCWKSLVFLGLWAHRSCPCLCTWPFLFCVPVSPISLSFP